MYPTDITSMAYSTILSPSPFPFFYNPCNTKEILKKCHTREDIVRTVYQRSLKSVDILRLFKNALSDNNTKNFWPKIKYISTSYCPEINLQHYFNGKFMRYNNFYYKLKNSGMIGLCQRSDNESCYFKNNIRHGAYKRFNAPDFYIDGIRSNVTRLRYL
jgi:hypothetical protein